MTISGVCQWILGVDWDKKKGKRTDAIPLDKPTPMRYTEYRKRALPETVHPCVKLEEVTAHFGEGAVTSFYRPEKGR